MVDFSDREEIKRWLDGIKSAKRRREVAIALAARATLRVTPLLGRVMTSAQAKVLTDFVLSSLRATAAGAWDCGRRWGARASGSLAT